MGFLDNFKKKREQMQQKIQKLQDAKDSLIERYENLASKAGERHERIMESDESYTTDVVQASQPSQSTPSTEDYKDAAFSSSPNDKFKYDEKLERFIDLALEDGVITDKEREILFKKAEAFGVDLDEFEMVLDNRLNAQKRCAIDKDSQTRANSDMCVQSLLKKLQKLEDVFIEETKDMGWFKKDFKEDQMIQSKVRIIKDHPLPQTKDGLLEMLAFAAPQGQKVKLFSGEDSYVEDVQKAWRTKCGQIISKARLMMRDDPHSLEIVNNYAKELGL